MTGLGAMLRKETLEVVRTRRLAVVLVLYALVGLGSPLLARAIPALLAAVPQDQLAGVELILTQDPSATDALVQYVKNATMLPVLAVLVSMGAFATEKRLGIAPMLLCRPLSRRAWYLAKLAVALALHTAGLLLAAGACLLYTRLLFGEIDLVGYLALQGALLLLLWVFVALTIFGSVLSQSTAVPAALGLGGWVMVFVLGALPSLARFTPAGLVTLMGDLVAGRTPVDPALTAGTSVGLLLLVVATDRVLSRQEL